MHQISPVPSAQATTRDAILSPLQQAEMIEHFDAFAQLKGDLDAVVCEACRVAAEGMGASFAGVLQYRADEDAFVLQAGFGWPARMVGRMRVTADLDTTAGLAWLTGQLVQFHQLDAIARIRLPEAMARHGVHRMVSVPIRDDGQKAFGVLEVGSAGTGEFTRHDLAFLQSIADSVAAAVSLRARRAGWTEQVELAVERVLALAGGSSTTVGRRGPAGTRYQQDTQVGAD